MHHYRAAPRGEHLVRAVETRVRGHVERHLPDVVNHPDDFGLRIWIDVGVAPTEPDANGIAALEVPVREGLVDQRLHWRHALPIVSVEVAPLDEFRAGGVEVAQADDALAAGVGVRRVERL